MEEEGDRMEGRIFARGKGRRRRRREKLLQHGGKVGQRRVRERSRQRDKRGRGCPVLASQRSGGVGAGGAGR